MTPATQPRGGFARSWAYRYFVLSSIATDFRLRVVRSRLGLVWLILSPLLQVAIYALVLSAVMRARLPGIDNQYAYAIYLLAGFLAWYPFTEIVTRCVTIFIDNANAMKKIAFPRAVLPLVTLGIAVVNNLIMLAVVLAAFLLMGHAPSLTVLWLPLILAVNLGLAMGLGLCCGVLNVFIRDIGQLVQIALQFGFWLTPIVYVIDIIPASYRWIIALNPVFWVVDNYHRVLVYDLPPNWQALGAAAALACLLLALGRFMLRRSQADMMDAL
ncbi:ABC transporter permease [Tianweitania sediminis]|uniref:Transport permease protein n=1 Tax=Tianweitania sediminis TaxID=1502156 RepID=A0A8J7R3H3_9HYPH|nr:ABC transporter permease [Tianweitania sediminis]MBP0441200.1 ABC transporter permease [Tianweitania sediminis]